MRAPFSTILLSLFAASTDAFVSSLRTSPATKTLIRSPGSLNPSVVGPGAETTPSLIVPEQMKSRKTVFGAIHWPTVQREINQWVRHSDPPKKKKVGVHSSLSQLAVGVAFVTFLPFFSPVFSWNPLKLRFFDIHSTNLSPLASIGQMKFCSVLFLLVAGLGNLRFCPRTIKSRKLIFEAITAGIVHLVAMSLSNVSGSSGGLFCAWSTIGRILLCTTCMGVSVLTSKVFYETITNPPGDANVFFESRFRALLSSSAYLFSFYSFYAVLMCQIFDSKQAFFGATQRLFEASGLTLLTEAFTRSISIFYFSMGAFYSTLQFEKRVPTRVTNTLLAATTLFLLFDAYKFHFLFFRAANMGLNPHAAVLSTLIEIRNRYHLRAIFWSPPIAAVVAGVWNKVIRPKLQLQSQSATTQNGDQRFHYL